jgi:hypothetical protein
MTVRLITRHITTVSLTIVAILLPITGTTNSENNGLSGITLRGVLSNGDLVLGQHRQNSLASSSSSGLQGSSGSGLRGSSGSGLRGSSGSGLRGSSGSGLRGSSGSGLRGSSGSGLRGSGGSGLPAFRGEPRYISSFDELPLLAVGPISEISTDGNIVEVLGQNIIIDDKTILITFDLNGELISIKEGLKNLDNFNKDDYMAAAGDLVDPGLQLGTILIKLPRRFTEGASLVYVRTILDSVDLSVGRALSGSTLIDFSATLYNTRNSLAQPGNVVEYFGYTGSSGSGLRGSSGSGLRGSSGSGFK